MKFNFPIVDQENKVSSIEARLLSLTSQWGGICKYDLLQGMSIYDSKDCSKSLKNLMEKGKIERLFSVTHQEYHWIS